MVVKRGLGIDVVTAARQRIIETFSRKRVVWLSFSGGKDSLVLASIVYDLILEGKIDKRLLRVYFIDEEAMYDDVIRVVKDWRGKFMEMGVPFEWYCLPVKHFNCLNTMSDEESFICWDPAKKDVWVREMPEFAITDDPFLIPYKDNYQAFCDRKAKAYNYIVIHGVRVYESIQRQKYIAKMKNSDKILPIYDMTDKDVWLYIMLHNIDIPDAYENLYRVGTPTNRLRISQFFSIDTAKSLVSLGEMYPDLMERVTRREPNAYLCALYWDTEMFGRTTANRRKLEFDIDERDYKALAMEIIRSENPEHPEVIKQLRPPLLRAWNISNSDWKMIYQTLQTGDPKGRKCRAIITRLFSKEKTR